MTSVGGCCPEADGACVPVVRGAEVGPEPASVTAKFLVTASISVVQGPALAELGIHDNSAKPVSMRIRGFITFSFSTSCSKINPGSAYTFRNFQSAELSVPARSVMTGRLLIESDRVGGTNIYDAQGNKLGASIG